MRLAIKRLDPAAQLPTRAHHCDAGMDLYALEAASLGAGRAVRRSAPVSPSSCRAGHAGLVLPRSGNAARHGIALVNAPGLIDEGYRGEIQVLLLNTDRDEPVRGRGRASRIAQLVVIKVATPDLVELDALDEAARGAGGFGSSGR